MEGRTVRHALPADALRVGETFRLYSRGREAVCELWSHREGWFLRMKIDGEPVREGSCGSHPEVSRLSDEWAADLARDGWA